MRALRYGVVLAVLPVIAMAQSQAGSGSAGPTWGPAPAVFPAGAKMAVMQGDPSKAELFTVRLDFPDGYRIAPHYHPTDEHITVISGTLLVGMGDTLDMSKAMVIRAGGFGTAPARMHHYASAKGHTIVQVHAMGPFVLTYVNPSDSPATGRR